MKLELIDALRSGRYAHGRKYLRSSDDKYCPMGVALDLLGVSWRLDGDAYNTDYVHREKLAAKVGLWPVIGAIFRAETESGREWSFHDYANWLETNTTQDQGV